MNIFSSSQLKKIFSFFFILIISGLFCFQDGNNTKFAGCILWAAPDAKVVSGERIDSIPSQLLEKMREGRYDEVISECRDIISQDHSFSRACKLLVQASAEKSQLLPSNNDLDETINFFRKLADKNPSIPHYYYGLGLCYKSQKNYPEAVENLEKSINLGADFYDVFDELAFYYKHKEDLDRAKNLIRKKIQLNPSNPFLYQGLGLIYFRLSEFNQGLSSWEKALELQEERGDRQAECVCLCQMGRLFSFINNYPQALDYLNMSIKAGKEFGDRDNEAFCLALISFVYYCMGDNSQAIEIGEKSVAISREIGNKKAEYEGLKTLGFVYVEKGDLARAQEFLERSLKFFEEYEDLRNQAVCQYWLSVVHHEKGEYTKALEYAKNSFRIGQHIGYKTSDAFSLTAIGDINFSLGNYAKALECNKNALKIAERKIAKWSEERCLNTIGHIYIKNNDFQQALEYFQQALDFICRIGHKREEAKCLYNIGYTYLKMGNLENAKKYFLKSVRQAEKHSNRMVLAFNFNSLGEIFFKRGDFNKSKQYYLKALSSGQAMGHSNIIWEAYSGLGSVSIGKKEYNQALSYYKNAIELIEALRSQIRFREYSTGFFRSKISIYEDIINLLYNLSTIHPSEDYAEECFYFVEKAKARAFLDDLQRAEIGFGTIVPSKTKQNEIEVLSGEISKILTHLYSYDLDEKKRDEFLYELELAENELQSVNEGINKEFFENNSLIYKEPSDLGEIQKELLDKRTGLIEYFVGERNLFIFFITQNALQVNRLSTENTKATLKLTKNFMKLLSTRDMSGFEGEIAAEKLYKRLINPSNKDLSQDLDKLVIVPDGVFYYLPFETLMYRKGKKGIHNQEYRYLIEDYEVSYAPSASVLLNITKSAKNQDRKKDLLAIGDPAYEIGRKKLAEPINADDIVREYYLNERFHLYPLQFALKEVRSISKLVKRRLSRTLTRKKAKEENIKELPLMDYKIIHFATHSFLDERIASRSALVLTLDKDPAEDGFFQTREIYNTKLNADLIVLSACQTAKGKIEKGEGIQGLSRAFFCAGTKSVLGSLWNINDRSTAEFMKNFYCFLVEGKSKQEALRLTKIKMLNSQFKHPYYWAAFVLIGEGKSNIALSKPSLWDKFLYLFNI